MKIKGIYFLYRVLQAFGLPALLLYFLLRAFRNGAYWTSLPQRLGFLPHSFKQTGPGALWLHAVSVGEVLACLELLRRMRKEFPRSRLFVSTSTLTGHALAREKLAGVADIFYAPVDYCFAVRRVLRTLKPSLLVVAETEIWPNLFREIRRIDAGLIVVNGRVSDRAFPRYESLRWFFSHVLPAADAVLAQSETMRQRFIATGAPESLVEAAGNLKYDFEPQPAPAHSPVRQFVERVSPECVWMAASTMPPAEPSDPDEDDAVVDAFRQLAPSHPRLMVILVPRKPERFPVAAAKLAAAGIPFARRSALPESLELPGVLLLDSIGELSGLFPLADVVFMGGSLASRGGHNILEPACFGRPVIVGPHMENFQEIADQFVEAGACLTISHAGDLAPAVHRLLTTPEAASELGARAAECARARRGATDRALSEIRQIYDSRIPRHRPAWPWLPLAWALSRMWQWGGMRRMRSAVLRRRRLDAPVVSIGNITMGGTGKTPCALLLARGLCSRGRRPGILTRGYGRNSPERHIAVPAGASVRQEHTGDEPQLFVRAGVAPVGIGPDRYVTGRMLEQQFGVDVLLLDDGFQHLRLKRSVDIVLIDALNPFAGGRVFPMGRLRESLDGLARADVFLITRSEFSDLVPAIERNLRYWNERAPVYRAHVQPEAWVDLKSGATHPPDPPPFRRAAAFCGLGNPQAFRKTLETLGLTIRVWVEFEDHHRYRPDELRRVVRLAVESGASALVTTEKDAINLCDGCDDILKPLPLFALRVSMRIDGLDDLLSQIQARI